MATAGATNCLQHEVKRVPCPTHDVQLQSSIVVHCIVAAEGADAFLGQEAVPPAPDACTYAYTYPDEDARAPIHAHALMRFTYLPAYMPTVQPPYRCKLSQGHASPRCAFLRSCTHRAAGSE